MSEEEILEIITSRLTIEIERSQDYYERHSATFYVKLKLDGEVISSDSMSCLV